MAMLDFMRRSKGPFVTAEKHGRNLTMQVERAPDILAQLETLGVTAGRSLRLEYFFYTDTSAKSAALAETLRGLGYQPREGPSASDRKLRLVTGWTPPIVMSKEKVCLWVRQMCELGYSHDCEFDGWGTTPDAT